MADRQDITRRESLLVAGAALGLASPTHGFARLAGKRPLVASDSDMAAVLPTISNWGRWGADDRRGTLNLLTPARRIAAVNSIRSGVAVSLARTIDLAAEAERGAYEMTNRPMANRDYVAMVFHGFAMTHLDALCHIKADADRLYNQVPSATATAKGCASLDVLPLADGSLAGRGVLLDIARLAGRIVEPGTAISIDQLESAERAQRVRVGEGDMLAVRTGAGRANTREKRAGLQGGMGFLRRGRAVALQGPDRIANQSDRNPVVPMPVRLTHCFERPISDR